MGFWRPKRTSKKKIVIWQKRARRKISCDVVNLFIVLVIIEISFGLYLSVGSESIETHTLTNNGKSFNECITRIEPNESSQQVLFQHIISLFFFHLFWRGLRF